MSTPYVCPACQAPVRKWVALGEGEVAKVVDHDCRPHACAEQGRVKPEELLTTTR